MPRIIHSKVAPPHSGLPKNETQTYYFRRSPAPSIRVRAHYDTPLLFLSVASIEAPQVSPNLPASRRLCSPHRPSPPRLKRGRRSLPPPELHPPTTRSRHSRRRRTALFEDGTSVLHDADHAEPRLRTDNNKNSRTRTYIYILLVHAMYIIRFTARDGHQIENTHTHTETERERQIHRERKRKREYRRDGKNSRKQCAEDKK